MNKPAERSGHRKILRRVAQLLSPLGFRRAKMTFFVRRRQDVIEFVHLHKYTFGPAFRVHLGIRLLNDDFQAQALNGPNSHGAGYNLRYEAEQESPDRCAAEIARYVSEVGSAWFDRFRDPQALLMARDSPFDERAKARLRMALSGNTEPSAVDASLKLFDLESVHDLDTTA